MFYRVTLDLAYPDSVNPHSIEAHAMTLLHQAVTINPGQTNEERGYIRLQECYHDQDPTLPCTLLEEHFTT